MGTKVSGCFTRRVYEHYISWTFNNASDRAYYQQGITQSAKDMVLPGEVNQAKKFMEHQHMVTLIIELSIFI
jgi:hypothetical protein